MGKLRIILGLVVLITILLIARTHHENLVTQASNLQVKIDDQFNANFLDALNWFKYNFDDETTPLDEKIHHHSLGISGARNNSSFSSNTSYSKNNLYLDALCGYMYHYMETYSYFKKDYDKEYSDEIALLLDKLKDDLQDEDLTRQIYNFMKKREN